MAAVGEVEQRTRVERRTLPLTLGQADRWRAEMGRENPIATIAFAFLVTGPLDVARLREAMRALLRRHPGLTAQLRRVDGAPAQVVGVADPGQIDLRFARAATFEDVLRLAGGATFHLSDPALFRAQLYELDATRHVLAVQVHHAIWDAVSDGVFTRELWGFYAGVELPPLTPSYDDVVEAQQAWLAAYAQRRIQHWAERLRSMPPSPLLPGAVPREHVTSFRGRAVSGGFALRGSRFEAASTASGSGGAAGLAMLATALARMTGQPDVSVGVLMSDRYLYGAAEQIGMFINTVPVHVPGVDPQACLEPAAARGALRLLADAYRWMLPRVVLAEELIPGRPMARCDINFNFISSPPPQTPRVEGLEIARVVVPRPPRCLEQASETWDGDNVWVDVSVREERVVVDVLFNEQLIEREHAALLVEQICAVAS